MNCAHVWMSKFNLNFNFFSLQTVEYSCGDTNSDPQEVIYFQNRNFPESATDPEICLFTVKIKDSSICQLRSLRCMQI